MAKIVIYISAVLLVTNVVSLSAQNNATKPVIFLTSPPTSQSPSTDNGNSESRINEKQAVASHGYNLEVINDNTEEAQERSGSENLKRSSLSALYSQTGGQLDQFLHSPDYNDENTAKEEIKDDFVIPEGKLSYGDIPPKTDISKVRDLFVSKRVAEDKSHPLNHHASESYPSSAPLESKYKLEYENPGKYVNTPIILKQSTLPLLEPSPVSAPIVPLSHPHHQGLLDVTGHTSGYGHGYHHHEQKLKSKPLKPSVVYRDPSDRFDHHDKIRTLDKDHLGGIEKDSRHPFGPHVIGKGHDFHEYGHGKKVVFEPTYYDQTKVPECAHKNKYIYNLTFCLDDPHYPVETIHWALKESHYPKKLFNDVTYQSADNLVTGLTRAEEEGYTYKHYFGASHAQNVHLEKYKPPYHGYTYSTDYFKKGGYLCPSDIYYARPKRAMNTFGKWKVIVNVDHVPEHGYDKYPHHPHHDYEYGKGHYVKDHDHHGKHYEKDHDHGHYGKSNHGHGYSTGLDHSTHGYGIEYSPEQSQTKEHSIKKREYKEPKKSYTQTLRLEQCM